MRVAGGVPGASSRPDGAILQSTTACDRSFLNLRLLSTLLTQHQIRVETKKLLGSDFQHLKRCFTIQKYDPMTTSPGDMLCSIAPFAAPSEGPNLLQLSWVCDTQNCSQNAMSKSYRRKQRTCAESTIVTRAIKTLAERSRI